MSRIAIAKRLSNENRYLNVGKSLYTVLDRLEDRQLITGVASLLDDTAFYSIKKSEFEG